MDLLALPTLTVIGDTLRSVKQNRDVHTDLSKIDGNEPAPFATLRNSGTIRTFQLESPTQGAITQKAGAEPF
jgi:DNA polymerase III alpha subunit